MWLADCGLYQLWLTTTVASGSHRRLHVYKVLTTNMLLDKNNETNSA
jgi:hypothetical protein